MCSGKSTLGRALARRLGRRFVDLDEYIEDVTGMTVSEIFATHGEPEFRRIESEALASVSGGTSAVVAVGGGTPCFGDNMSRMNDTGTTVWLQAPVGRLLERLRLGADQRPLVAGKTDAELERFVAASLAGRNPYYALAQWQFDSSTLENSVQIAESVERFIDQIINQ